MGSNGIKRKIDEVGRVVIPKNIRDKLNLNIGDEVDFFVEMNDNKIIIQKIKNQSSIHQNLDKLSKAIAASTGMICCICLNDEIAFSSDITIPTGVHSTNFLSIKVRGNVLFKNEYEHSTDTLYFLNNRNDYIVKKMIPLKSDEQLICSIVIIDVNSDSILSSEQNNIINTLIHFAIS